MAAKSGAKRASVDKSLAGAQSRPQGKTGINLLRRLAKDFLVEESGEDYGGWDIQLEETQTAPSSSADFLGRRGCFTYKFQVKSPRKGSKCCEKRSVGIELQHWERACKSSYPWFVLIAIVDDDDDSQEDDVCEAYLVHLDATWLAKAAKRLSTSADMQAKMQLTWSELHRIHPRTRRTFKQMLRSEAGTDPLVYAAKKQYSWSQAGFERRFTALSNAASTSLSESQLADIYLGRQTVSAESLVEIETRFGMDVETGSPAPGVYGVLPSGRVELAIYRASRHLAGLVKHRGQLQISNVEVFHSGPVLKYFPKHQLALRFTSSCLDIVVTNNRFHLEIALGPPTAPVSLMNLAAAAYVHSLRDRAHRCGGLFCVAVVAPPNVWSTPGTGKFKIPPWKREVYKSATAAYAIIQKLGGSADQAVTVVSLIQQRNAIWFMRACVCEDRRHLQFAGSIRLDAPSDHAEFRSPVPFVVAIQLGSFRAVLAGIIVRSFSKRTEREYNWTMVDFEILVQEAGERLSESLPTMAFGLVSREAELRCQRDDVPFIELAGFTHDRWPESLPPAEPAA